MKHYGIKLEKVDDYFENPIVARFSKVVGLEGEIEIDYHLHDVSLLPEDQVYELQLLDGDVESDVLDFLLSGATHFNENMWICILDKDFQPLAGYWFYEVSIQKVHLRDLGTIDLTCWGGLWKASKGAIKSYEMMLSGNYQEIGSWRELDKDERQGWLEVALKSSNQIEDKKGLDIVIDGNYINNRDAFYCSLGEAINGPWGYYGRNLDALEDCCQGRFGANTPMKILWINSSISKSQMPDFEEFTATLQEIFKDWSIDFRLDKELSHN